MTRRQIWAGALTALMLAITACTVGPNYRRPRVTVPQQWPVVESSSTVTTRYGSTAEIQEWWKSFHDPELDSLVSRAITSNLDLKIATDRVQEARAMIGIARSGGLPQVNINDSASRFRQVGTALLPGTALRPSVERFPFEMNLFQPQATMSWELDLFGRVRRGTQAAAADARAQIEDRRNVLVTLLGDVGANYAETRGFQLRLAIAQKNIGSEEETLALTRDLSQAGQTTERDVAQAEAQLELTRASVPTLATALNISIHRLSVLLGLDPEALKPELTEAAPLPVVPPEVPVGLPSDLLTRRPDIRKAEAQLEAATARVGVAKADYFPTLALTGAAGRAAPQLQEITAGINTIFSLGPSLTLPVFTGGRVRANVAAQTARVKATSAEYESAVLTALEETDNALVSYSNERDRLDRLQKVVDADRTALELAEVQYKAGLADFLTVLDAERTLSQNEDLLAQSQVSVVTDLITLYRSLGGGWSGPH